MLSIILPCFLRQIFWITVMDWKKTSLVVEFNQTSGKNIYLFLTFVFCTFYLFSSLSSGTNWLQWIVCLFREFAGWLPALLTFGSYGLGFDWPLLITHPSGYWTESQELISHDTTKNWSICDHIFNVQCILKFSKLILTFVSKFINGLIIEIMFNIIETSKIDILKDTPSTKLNICYYHHVQVDATNDPHPRAINTSSTIFVYLNSIFP